MFLFIFRAQGSGPGDVSSGGQKQGDRGNRCVAFDVYNLLFFIAAWGPGRGSMGLLDPSKFVLTEYRPKPSCLDPIRPQEDVLE